MAVADVRLIVLATVRHLEPATGYAVRKHLVDQGVDTWGGVSTASIYSVLRTLARHGHLEEIADPTGIRRNTKAYRTTTQGLTEFDALWRRAVETVDPAHPLAFHVAVTLTALVTKDDYVAALWSRLKRLEERPGIASQQLPPQTANAARLWRALADAEVRWIRETIEIAQQEHNSFGFPVCDSGRGVA